MKPEIPTALLEDAGEWKVLHRWERKQLGLKLRRLGLTYSEIMDIIPVPKGTLSSWCKAVPLDRLQLEAIEARTGQHNYAGLPKDTQWRRRNEIAAIRRDAAVYGSQAFNDPLFVAGVSLYWAEGSKTRNDLSMTNTDPRVLAVFIAFTRTHLDAEAAFSLALHLHQGDDDHAAKHFWSEALGLANAHFTKSYIKPSGTGHRKKRLPHGCCRVRVRRASDHWHRTMQWIDLMADLLTG